MTNQDANRQGGSYPVSLICRGRDRVWEKLQDETGCPDLLQGVYRAGLRDDQVLKSLASLSVPRSRKCTESYDQNVLTFAKWLAKPLPLRKHLKLASIRVLMTLRTPLEAGWQLQEPVIQDTLRFITDRNFDFEHVEHFDIILLWELRAICLMEIESLREQVRQKVVQGGESATNFISQQAVRVERGLELSTDVLSAGIEGAGERLKQVLPPAETCVLEDNPRARVVSLTYSDAAKRATDSLRESSRGAMDCVKSASVKGIGKIASRLQDGGVGERLVPNEQDRTVLSAVGKLGVASVGAAALVTDSLMGSTSQVAKKTAEVTADIVEHAYGPTAAQICRNSHDTVGNILRTVGNVTFMRKGKAMTKSAAKETGKMHLHYVNAKSSMDEVPSDDEELFLEADENIFLDEELVQVQDTDTAIKSTDKIKRSRSCGELVSHDALFGEVTEFDTTLTLTPSELDALPDQITSIDAQSDSFSDITVEPIWRSLSHCYSSGPEDSKSSIFRSLKLSVCDGAHITNTTPNKSCCLDGEESLNDTACTVDESFLSSSTVTLAQHDNFRCENVLATLQNDSTADMKSVNSLDIETADQKTAQLCQANRIPPNGYIPEEGDRRQQQSWRYGIYTSVKSSFAI